MTLFDMEHSPPPERPAGAKSVRQGNCPMCLRGKTGLVRVGRHIAWRDHTYRTHGGLTLPCQASGVTACVAAERKPLDPSNPVRCPHS